MEGSVEAEIIIQTSPCPENANSGVYSEIGDLLGAVEFIRAKPFLNVGFTLTTSQGKDLSRSKCFQYHLTSLCAFNYSIQNGLATIK